MGVQNSRRKIIAGTSTVGGAIIAEKLLAEQLSAEQLSPEHWSMEQISAEQMSMEQMSPEHLSRSIYRGAFVAFLNENNVSFIWATSNPSFFKGN